MKFRDRLSYALSGGILVFAAVFSNAAVAGDLLELPFPTVKILLVSAFLALVSALLLLTPHPALFLTIPALLAPAVFFLFRESWWGAPALLYNRLTWSSPIRALFTLLSVRRPQSSSFFNAEAVSVWILAAVGLFWGLVLAFLLARRSGTFWYTAFGVLFFASFAVLLGEMPSFSSSVVFAALHLTLLLSSLLLTRGSPRAGIAVLALILPAVLISFGSYALLSVYERPAFADRTVKLAQTAWNEFTRARRTGSSSEKSGQGAAAFASDLIGAFPWNTRTGMVYLHMGPRPDMPTPVMEVYSDRSRTLYLRGASYGRYTGLTWQQLSAEGEPESLFPSSLFTTDSQPREELRLRTETALPLLYLPYTPTELPTGAAGSKDSFVRNKKLTEYRILLNANAAYAPVSWEYRNYVFSRYTEVPDTTREELAPLIAQFDPEDPNLVYKAADYVRNHARYDRDTPAVPATRDFVGWFLMEYDRGYCVHFASAAAILLRCLGIPARYVTGYLVEAEGGAWTTVTENDAHAWVEYFDDSLASWRMLEVTSSLDAEGAAEEEETRSDTPAAPLPNLYENQDDDEREEEPEEEGTGEAPDPVRRSSPLRIVLPAVLIPLAAAVLWPVVRREHRRRMLGRASPNERAVTFYRLTAKLDRASGRPVSAKEAEILRFLAEKARFSRHLSTEAELGFLEKSLAAAEKAVRERGKLPVRLWNRWFYGV